MIDWLIVLVFRIIEEERADIVFLQEVTTDTFTYISEKLPDYQCISGYEVSFKFLKKFFDF
jgi:endonuclease/exonuclease/phosphatase family metal-dependent hydrolase